MDATHQVVIVGAGPAGMVTALLLGDLGVDCLVVDKRTQISPLPRARGIHARASEILVSSTVSDIVTGSRRAFVDRGEYELKGVPGSWRLYALARGGVGRFR